jgi:nucleoside 2-deoxyribosyltransferase
MNVIEYFGINWTNKSLDHRLGSINILTNNEIGEIALTLECLQFSEWSEGDYYKILSLIRERTIYGRPYFIYLTKEYGFIDKLTLDKYTVISKDNFLSNFPKNIIEIQSRALMLLQKQYPKYGQDMEQISQFDFFAEDNDDLIFIMESMVQKNWLDIKISKAVGGQFNISSPSIIAEDGWMEIERNLDKNYSKQVFVAMWFDSTMDNAYVAIEKAIAECGLNILRIDRKEHNNEISGEILFEIKKSRIIIADVTGQRNGVYFEAGFAMGHQKTVIWSCRENDLKNIHFDTRQYNHVLWKDENDLYSKMKNRLLATLAVDEK